MEQSAALASDLQQERFVRQRWCVKTTSSIDEVQKPAYWRMVAGQINVGDWLEIVHEDQDFMLELYVVDVDRGSVRTHLVTKVELPSAVKSREKVNVGQVYLRNKGATEGWSLFRKESKAGPDTELRVGLTRGQAIQAKADLEYEAVA